MLVSELFPILFELCEMRWLKCGQLKSLEDFGLPWQWQTCTPVPKVCLCTLGCWWEDARRAEGPGTLRPATVPHHSSEPWASLAACLWWRWQEGGTGLEKASELVLFSSVGTHTYSLSGLVFLCLFLELWIGNLAFAFVCMSSSQAEKIIKTF